MNLLRFALVTALPALCVSTDVLAKETVRRPNIILIMADDLGYECLSCNGCRDYRTPHLDQLAASGVRFEHAYSQPICTPSRVQIMTGRYNSRNYQRFGLLPKGETTFANLLRDAGYKTAIIGKWQLDGNSETVKRFGFEHHCLWHLGGRQSRYWQPRIVEDGIVLKDVADRYGPDVMSDYGMRFMEDNRDTPFLLYYPAALTHYPYVPTPDSPTGGSRERLGRYDGARGGEEYFDDMVEYLDQIVGRIVAKLEALNLRDDTLILFTGDNGCTSNLTTGWQDRKIRGGKGTMPDAGTHAPLVASWPTHMPRDMVSDTLVDFSDFLPTLCEAAKVTIPDHLQLDGQSFLPLLEGQKTPQRAWIFCHYQRNAMPVEPQDPEQRKQLISKQAASREAKTLGRFARTQRYKLYDDGRFYDVASDPLEQHEFAPRTQAEQATHRMLKAVHLSMPAWRSFRDPKPAGSEN